MKFGVSIFPTDYSISLHQAARAAEEAGLESIFVPEHTHIPTATAFPLGDGTVPRHYKSTLDPFVALAAAAAVTSTIQLATGICLVPQRDPFTLAKEVATLDLISNGRVILGIGAGWNEPETRNHGTDFDHRFAIMRERVEAMKQLWTQDVAEYHGKHVDFGPAWSYPKPVQKPHPPVLIGGTGPHILKRIVAYGDGWLPIPAIMGPETFGEQVAELRRLAKEAGRPRPDVTIYTGETDPESVARYEAMGVDRMVWGLDSAPAAEVLPKIAEYGEAMKAAAR